MRVLVRTITALTVAAGLLLAGPAGTAAADPAPTVGESELAGAVWCDPTLAPGSGRTAVLLVHGTGSTPSEAWGWNYVRTLPTAGYAVCTVTLPGRANGSFTVSAEYAAYAARYAIERSGRDIAIVGHSQGGLIAAWVATYWPEIAAHTSDVVALAAPLNGTVVANTLCAGGACSPLAWQLAAGSRAITALQNADRPAGPAYTSIATVHDEVVQPQPRASTLPGARTILLQQICTVRATDHGTILADSVANALVLDALGHDGPASASRIDRGLCLQQNTTGVDLVGAAPFYRTIASLGIGLINVATWTRAEPDLPAYADES